MAFDLTAQLNLTLNRATLSQVAQQINKQLASSEVKVTSNYKDVAKLSQEIRRADDDIRAFGAQAGLAAKRFAAFTLSAGVMIQVASAIRSAFGEAIQLNTEMVRLTQITDGNKSAVRDITNEVMRLSTSLGVSSTELMKQATTLKQASLSARETKIALEALAKASLAPSFDNMAKTTEAAIAAMKQFNMPAEELKNILGSINSVAAAFAVEAGDLGQAITRAGGAFKAAGGDLHELNAMMTAIRQTTRESAESIATGLRTIFTRLQRGGTVDALKSVGVNLRYTADEARALGNINLTGQFIGIYQAVMKVSEALRDIPTTDARYARIVEELGGYRQISKVIPLIQQQALMQDALNISRAGGASLDAHAAQAQEGYIVRLVKIRQEFLKFMVAVTESSTFKVLFAAFETAAHSAITLLNALKPLLPMLAALAAVKIAQGAGGLLGGFLGSLGKSPPVTNIKGKHFGGAIRMQKGGVVPGHGSGDIVPAMLEPGEIVIPKRFAPGGNINTSTIKGGKKFEEVFKDSKFRDEETGEHKIGYHGTRSDFDTFKYGKTKRNFFGKGFYHTTDRQSAESYSGATRGDAGANVMANALNMKNPFNYVYEKEGNIHALILRAKLVQDQNGQITKESWDKAALDSDFPKKLSNPTFEHTNKILARSPKLQEMWWTKMRPLERIPLVAHAFTKALQKQGYDSINVDYGNDEKSDIQANVVFRSNQIKSVHGNDGSWDEKNSNINKALGGAIIPKRFAEGGGNIFETAVASKKSSLKTLYDVGLRKQKYAKDKYTEIKINKTFGENPIEAHLRDRETIRDAAKTVWDNNKIEIDTEKFPNTLEKLKNRKNKNNTWNSIIIQSEHKDALTKFDQEEINVLAKIKATNAAMKEANSFMQVLGPTELNSIIGRDGVELNTDENRLNKISGAIGENEVFEKNNLYRKLEDVHGADFYDPTSRKFIEVKTNLEPANDHELRAKALIGYSEIKGNPFQNRRPQSIPNIVIDYQQAAKRPIKKASGGFIVPGVGNTDSVPMDLASGSYVIRKSSTQKLGFAKGGMVPTLLTPGELVIGPDSAKSLGFAKLEQMNKHGRFALGGRVGMAEGGNPSKEMSNEISVFMKDFATKAYASLHGASRSYTEISGQSKSTTGEQFPLLAPKDIIELRRAITESFQTGAKTVKASIGGKVFQSPLVSSIANPKQAGFLSSSMFNISKGAQGLGRSISSGAQKIGPAISDGAKSAWGTIKDSFTPKLTALTEQQISIMRVENDIAEENLDRMFRKKDAVESLKGLYEEQANLAKVTTKLEAERVEIINNSNKNRIKLEQDNEKINTRGKDKVVGVLSNMEKGKKQIDDKAGDKILALQPARDSIKKLEQKNIDISDDSMMAKFDRDEASKRIALAEQDRAIVKGKRAPYGGGGAKKAELARIDASILKDKEIEFKADQEIAGNAVLLAANSQKIVEETAAHEAKIKKIKDNQLKAELKLVDATTEQLNKIAAEGKREKETVLKKATEKSASLAEQSDKNIIESRSVKERSDITNEQIKKREGTVGQPLIEVFTGKKLAAQRAQSEIKSRTTGNAVVDAEMAKVLILNEEAKVHAELVQSLILQQKALNPLISAEEATTVALVLAEKHMNEMAVMPLPSAGGPASATSSNMALTLQQQGKDPTGKKSWKTQAKEGVGDLLGKYGMGDAMDMYEEGKAGKGGKGGRMGGIKNLMKGGNLLKLGKGLMGALGTGGVGALATLGTDFVTSKYGSQTADEAVKKGDKKTYKTTQAISSTVSGAATGALIGSFIPGVGTAIGAVIGGLYGLTTSLFKSSSEIREAEIEQAMGEFSDVLDSVSKGYTAPEEAMNRFAETFSAVQSKMIEGGKSGEDLNKAMQEKFAKDIPAISRVLSSHLSSQASALVKGGKTSKESVNEAMNSQKTTDEIDRMSVISNRKPSDIKRDLKAQLDAEMATLARTEADIQSTNAAMQLSRSMDLLESYMIAAMDSMESMSNAFDSLGGIFTQGVSATKVVSEGKILGNPQGYSQDEVRGSIGRTFAPFGGEVGGALTEKYGAMGSVRQALTSSMASGTGAGKNTEDFGASVMEDIRQRVGNAPGAEAIYKELERKLVGQDFDKILAAAGGDVSKAIDNLMADIEKPLREGAKKIADLQANAATAYIGGLVTLANQQKKINEETMKLKMMEIDINIARIELQKMSNGEFVNNQLDTAKQNIATTQEKQASAQAATFGGTSYEGQGSFNVGQLANIMRESQGRVQSTESNMNQIGPAGLVMTPQGQEAAQSNIQAKSDFDAAHTALRNMVDSGQQLAEMYKAQAEALRQSRASILGYAEALENADPRERARLKSGEAIANKVATGVDFNSLTKREKEDYKKFSSAAGKDYQLDSGKTVAQVEDMKGVALAKKYGLGGKLAQTESGMRDASGKTIDAQTVAKDAQKALVDFQVEQQKQQFALLMQSNVEIGLKIQQAILMEQQAVLNKDKVVAAQARGKTDKAAEAVDGLNDSGATFAAKNAEATEKAIAIGEQLGPLKQASAKLTNSINNAGGKTDNYTSLTSTSTMWDEAMKDAGIEGEMGLPSARNRSEKHSNALGQLFKKKGFTKEQSERMVTTSMDNRYGFSNFGSDQQILGAAGLEEEGLLKEEERISANMSKGDKLVVKDIVGLARSEQSAAKARKDAKAAKEYGAGRQGKISDMIAEDRDKQAKEKQIIDEKEGVLNQAKNDMTGQQDTINANRQEVEGRTTAAGNAARGDLQASGVITPQGVQLLPKPPVGIPLANAATTPPNIPGNIVAATIGMPREIGPVGAGATQPTGGNVGGALGVTVPPVGNNQAQTKAMLEYLSANQQQNDADFAAGISAIEAQYSVGGGATQPTGGNVGGARNKPLPQLDEAINEFFLSTTLPNIPGNIKAANAKMNLGGAPTVTTSSQSTISAKKEGGAEISEMDKLASALQPFSDNFSMSIGRFETSVYSFGESVTHFDEAVSKIPQTLELSTSNDVTVKLQDSQEIISALTDSIVSTVISKIREELDNSQSISQKSL